MSLKWINALSIVNDNLFPIFIYIYNDLIIIYHTENWFFLSIGFYSNLVVLHYFITSLFYGRFLAFKDNIKIKNDEN